MKKWRLSLIILSFVALLFIISLFNLIKWPKDIFWRAVRPIGLVLNLSFGKIPRFFSGFTHLGGIVKQNQNLIKENLELQAELAKVNEVKYENEILKKELNFAKTSTDSNIGMPAAVIGRTSGYLKSITVDKGGKDGLIKGQAAISQGFLVGTVGEVRSDTADIILITDYNSLIPVVLQDSRGTGLLRGGLGGLIVEDIPLNIGIKKNESLVTSGLGGQIPNGIVIGTVKEVISKPGEIFQKISIGSPIDFSQLAVIFIIKND